MPDENPYKHLRPKSASGAIRKMQQRDIREQQMQWTMENIPPPPPGRPQGVYLSCSCGNNKFIEGDPAELIERRFRCRCGKLI